MKLTLLATLFASMALAAPTPQLGLSWTTPLGGVTATPGGSSVTLGPNGAWGGLTLKGPAAWQPAPAPAAAPVPSQPLPPSGWTKGPAKE